MNCQAFEDFINELARDEMMETGSREQALTHGAECEVCALRLKRERMLTVELRTLATKMRSMKASGRLEEELMAAFRNRGTWEKSSRATNNRTYLVAAVAALLVLVFGMVVVRFRLMPPSQNLSSPPEFAKVNTGSPAPTSMVSPSPEALPGSVPLKHKIGIARQPGHRNVQRPVGAPARSRDETTSVATAKAGTAMPG
ncbi:MAG: hypothetical protein M3R67_13030 [Acidobacteriota bacterium]|nr:hypothetical protein [Acidobacteriota bacterium]